MERSADDAVFERARTVERLDQKLQKRAASRESAERTAWEARQHPMWSWIPTMDANGHPLGPGTINLSFAMCGCPAVRDGRGHYIVRCRVLGCDAAPIMPPGHVRPTSEQG